MSSKDITYFISLAKLIESLFFYKLNKKKYFMYSLSSILLDIENLKYMVVEKKNESLFFLSLIYNINKPVLY